MSSLKPENIMLVKTEETLNASLTMHHCSLCMCPPLCPHDTATDMRNDTLLYLEQRMHAQH